MGKEMALSYTSVPHTSLTRDTERGTEQENWVGED